jgi:hypothetical protein
VSYTNILESLAGLVSSAFVDDMEYRFAGDIENIDDNRVIEIDIISQIELELSGRLVIFLVVLIVFRKVFQSSSINIVPCSFEYILQSAY